MHRESCIFKVNMEPLAIADKIKEKFPDEVLGIKEFRGQVAVTLKKGRMLEIARDTCTMSLSFILIILLMFAVLITLGKRQQV